jgi:hypothetical protein
MTTKMKAKLELRWKLVSPSTFATNLGGKKEVSNPVYHQCMF